MTTPRHDLDYRQLLENLEQSHFLYAHDVDGNFTYLSPSVRQILGYAPEEFLTHYSRFMTDHPANAEVAVHTAACLRGEQQAPYRLQIIDFVGAKRWLEVSENPLRDEAGTVIGVQGIASDVTARVQSEELLRESEAKFKHAFHNDMILSTLTTLPEGEILDANAAWLKFFKLDRDRTLGRNLVDLPSFMPREVYEQFVRALESTGSIPEVELVFCDGEGSARTVLFSAARVLVGDRTCALAMAMDITDRKFVEQERTRLLAEEKLSRLAAEALAREREEFLSVAAHELKTPLAALTLQVEGMQRLQAKGGAGPEIFTKGLEVSSRQVQRLVRLVTSLLEVSRVKNGRFELNCRIIDLVPLIAGVLERFDAMICRAGCVATYSGDESLMGCWDSDRIEQVVENLVSNALKYGAGSGIELTGEADARAIQLRVRDHGIGIPEDDPDRIFEPYERAGAEIHYGGLGMGLYIAREIVRAHGGTIAAERMGDGGTIFTVTLPR